jgi:hypothetical protein
MFTVEEMVDQLGDFSSQHAFPGVYIGTTPAWPRDSARELDHQQSG